MTDSLAEYQYNERAREVCAKPRRYTDDEIAEWCAQNADKLKVRRLPKEVHAIDGVALAVETQGDANRKRRSRMRDYRRGTR